MIMRMKYLVSVVGASGYAGGEVLRLLAHHPALEPRYLAANTSRGTLGQYHRHIYPYADMPIQESTPDAIAQSDVVFLGLPHGTSAALSAQIAECNPECIIIDLGADHRLLNPQDWEEYYHSPASEPWEYAMPELIRVAGPSSRERLSRATHIAAPGCNASAVTFAVQPFAQAGLLSEKSEARDGIVAVLSVGYSGAGKNPKPHLLASEAFGGALAYGVGGTHRHIPEILQNITLAGGASTALSFTPILGPFARGILASVSVPCPGLTQSELEAMFTQAYADEPFIHIATAPPSTKEVLGSNNVSLYPVLDKNGKRATVICVLDNLVKGTAGAALQSLNIALGLDETTGLSQIGVAP